MKPIRIIFFGTPDFAAIGLKALLSDSRYEVACVVTQPDRPSGRGNKLQPSAVKVVAAAKQIPILQPERIKREKKSFLAAASKHGPYDVGVVIAFGQILPLEVLGLPNAGSVNVHASLLPRWRGAAPIQRAILAGDAKTGICLMQMDQGLDTGAVYCLEELPVSATDTAGSLHDKLADIGARLLCNKLPEIVNQSIIPVPQSNSGVSIASRISNEEAQIDWSASAEQIARLIRAFNPFPGAFTDFQGRRLKVFGAKAKTTRTGLAPLKAGTVYFSDAECLEIQCGADILALTDVQLEGKRRLSIAEFVKGVSTKRGEVLGDPS